MITEKHSLQASEDYAESLVSVVRGSSATRLISMPENAFRRRPSDFAPFDRCDRQVPSRNSGVCERSEFADTSGDCQFHAQRSQKRRRRNSAKALAGTSIQSTEANRPHTCSMTKVETEIANGRLRARCTTNQPLRSTSCRSLVCKPRRHQSVSRTKVRLAMRTTLY